MPTREAMRIQVYGGKTCASKGRSRNGARLSSSGMQANRRGLVELLAREVEERGREKGEHENTEEIAGREWSHQLGAEGEKVGTPGETKNGCNEMRDAIGNLRVLQKSDDYPEQPENASGGNQAAG